MNAKSKTGFEILKVAGLLGLLGDILLRQTPWGLNVLLFNLVFVAGAVLLLLRRKREYLNAQTMGLLLAQVFFAAMFVWRDSIELRIADSAAIVLVLSVLFVPQLKVSPRLAGVFHYGVGFLWSSLNAAFAPVVLLASDVEWKSADRSSVAKNTIAVLRGLLIALPLLLVFGALFVAADAAYQGMVERVFNIRPEIVFTHVLLTAVFAWASAGYLRGLLLGNEPKFTVDPPIRNPQTAETNQSKVDELKNDTAADTSGLPDNISILEHINRSDPPNQPAEAKSRASKWEWNAIESSLLPQAFTLGRVEIGIVLGLIDLLFLSFVLVQLPYLFGGMEFVQNTADFKLAEYARRGFGELVGVSALVLPLLLLSHWLIRSDDAIAKYLYKGLAGVQIVLLFIIMASATQRLLLLTGSLGYGLTTIRLYPMIFMSWLAVVFVWFALTVLRDRRQNFAWGALWSAFFVLGTTHVLNPDEFIVNTNVRLYQSGRPFDAKYNSRLSDDAVPALLNAAPLFDREDWCVIAARLNKRRESAESERDLRSWNLSRGTATFDIERATAPLDTSGCAANPSPPPIANED